MRIARPPRGRGFGLPRISRKLMHSFEKSIIIKEYNPDKGGIYETTHKSTETFMGVILPLNNEDIQYLPDGTSTVNSKKLYTNGYTLSVGKKVTDTLDENTYTIITKLTYRGIHSIKRYIVSTKGAASVG